MAGNLIKNIAIVFGKEDNNSFNRYTFPILSRPAALYPLMAAIHSEKTDSVYLSSDSPGLLNIGRNLKNIRILEREISQPTLIEEVQLAIKLVIDEIGYKPETVTILLANSPCIAPENINEAITILEKNPDYDSAATAMKRVEFNPAKIFALGKNNNLIKNELNDSSAEDPYFLDRRIMTVRTNTLLNPVTKNDYFEGLLGKNIYAIIQQEGIWDIDYIWQVPVVERWLRQNGFTDTETPYDNINKKPLISWKIPGNKEAELQRDKSITKVLITTVPFGEIDPGPVNLLKNTPGIEYIINPIGRKLKENELIELVKEFNIIIAGTEPLTRRVMESGSGLKLISRVGIGLDSVDLKAADELGIKVSYTPDAPAPAVAELTMGLMINLLRRVPLVDRKLRSGIWQRIHGERLANITIGIIGTGRIGSRVLRHLQGFNPKKILVNDLKPDYNLYEMCHAEFADKEVIFAESDIISLHIPRTKLTKNLINESSLGLMKKNVLLVNTSRGGIINENDLYDALKSHRIGGAALDVFENEPYTGKLIELDSCYLSCHMGSMTNDCRAAMEIQATEEVCRFVRNEPLRQLVPAEEYEIVPGK